MKEITNEMVNTFLNGRDPMERIITIECGYTDDRVSIVYINEKGVFSCILLLSEINWDC